jgi:hypothetical protein
MSLVSSEPSPFFIVCCSRSGSTLLQTLLDAHPNLSVPPESQIYYRFGPVFPYYGDLSVSENRRCFIRDLLNDAYIQQWNLETSVDDIEEMIFHPSRAKIIEAIFRLYAEKKGAKRWGDKTPEHIRYLSLIREDFPNARLIHLVRDGRDVAEAYQRMMFGPVSPLGLGREWRREVMFWREFQQQQGTDHTLEVRYEDLVRSPEDVLRTIAEFIEEPFVNTTGDYTNTELSNTLGDESWHSSLQSGIRTDKVGVYRQRFSEREIELFEYVAGDALSAYGYALEYQNPRGPDVRDRLYAAVADRVVRWYRKLFHLKVVGWDLQYRSRMLFRRIRWRLYQ